MREVDLLVALAGSAGVFVGFGALIAVRGGGASDFREVVAIRWMTCLGLWVVVAGLVPAGLGAYDLGDRDIWFACSLVGLVGLFGTWLVNFRTPETQGWVTTASRAQMARDEALNFVLAFPMLLALIVVALGLSPDRDAALYLSAVMLGLFLAGLCLLWLVFLHHPTVSASDGAERPAG